MPTVRRLAVALAANRVAYGAGMLLSPGLHGRMWIGRGARDERTKVLGRAMGVRDLAIGTAALVSLQSGDATRVREWFAVQTATDAGDLVATLVAGGRMPPAGRAFAATAAAGSLAIAIAAAVRAEETAAG